MYQANIKNLNYKGGFMLLQNELKEELINLRAKIESLRGYL